MEQDRINQIKANSTHVDDNFNTLLNAVNGKLDLDGTSSPTSDVSWNGHKISNLATPTFSADAATKGYVDSAITGSAAPATTSTLGQVIVGDNINVDVSGKISVADASTSAKGVVQFGKTDTIANAATVAARKCSVTNAVPSSPEDGVIYFVYAE
jgi:hypothetical protein